MNTSEKIGLRPTEYNALIHAIWRIDRLIKSTDEILTAKEKIVLERDRDALEALFVRLG
jgi:hypothetical protein